jgi:tRNA pseudouridine38-40 synthase
MQNEIPERNVAIEIAYDGTHFFGFQRTKEGKSIEEELQNAIEKALQHKVSINAASRTDRGVHAKGQIAAFRMFHEMELKKLKHILNCLLPKEIRVMNMADVPLSFHPTIDARKKEYQYLISLKPIMDPFIRRYAWHLPQKLNVELMKKASTYLIGEKDFICFQNSGRKAHTTVRNLERIDISGGDILQITLTGNSFLYKMVRNIVGTLVYVGLEKIKPDELLEILEMKDRKKAGITAPALGLCLNQVFYEPELFT